MLLLLMHTYAFVHLACTFHPHARTYATPRARTGEDEFGEALEHVERRKQEREEKERKQKEEGNKCNAASCA